ncbi:hypothetical protein CBR_g42119 [Chara braunii]|uniref:Uncharacterized protein n=1 Tax=Chara braunii TaxID=69332 RepID=A0A388LWZ5_CHABU|nr:hypothetical protein CBR_g42119 [Chara braunii]|eukprot:GBG86836.1 hypothetical protein CBR_g42119 [Chara braunii]
MRACVACRVLLALLIVMAMLLLLLGSSSFRRVEGRRQSGSRHAHSLGAASPPDVVIKSVKQSGSGCPTRSLTRWVLTEDKGGLSISLQNFEVSVTNAGRVSRDTVKEEEEEEECSLAVEVSYPARWQFLVSHWSVQGFMELDKTLSAELRSKYTVEGSSVSCSGSESLTLGGKRSGYKPHSLLFGASCARWTPCRKVSVKQPPPSPSDKKILKKRVTIRNTLSIKNRDNTHSSGYVKVEVIDAELEWKQC